MGRIWFRVRMLALALVYAILVTTNGTGATRQSQYPEATWTYKVESLDSQQVEATWKKALGLKEGTVSRGDSYSRFDHDDVSITHYALSDDVIVTHRVRKYGAPALTWRLSDDEITRLAAGFLESSGVLPMSEDDRLAPAEVRHVIDQEIDVDRGTRTQQVNVGIALFERFLDGIPAVGAGAHAAVFVASDRSIVGADISWRKVTRHRRVRITAGVDLRRDVIRSMGTQLGRVRSVDDGQLGYYFGPRGVRQSYVAPVFVFQSESDDELGRAAKWLTVVPASTEAPLYADTPLASGATHIRLNK